MGIRANEQEAAPVTRLTIGQIAAQSGASIETLRYYERFGLLQTPERTSSNYRLYSTEAIRVVKFIRQAQELGFALKDIKQLLYLQPNPTSTSAEVKELSQKLLMDIENRIETLQAMRSTLSKLVDECTGNGPVHHCPILNALDS